VGLLQDIAGGLVVTAPGVEDFDHLELGASVDKYLAGGAGVSGRDRWELIELIRDLTASEFGGYNYVVTLHGEGSPAAQLVQAVRDGGLERCVQYARDVIGSGAIRPDRRLQARVDEGALAVADGGEAARLLEHS
jgi:4-hydroxybutyryl-CoA dehydratase/vinylacetyl-CoA-Delta-isomerase